MTLNSIYLHIPFCNKKCNYCSFYSVSKSEHSLPSYVEFLQKEIYEYSRIYNLEGTEIKTIYFGGGTPSILQAENIKMLINSLKAIFNFSEDIEITLEANPETLTPHFLSNLRSVGVNRLSIGAQSFIDEELKFLGRLHGIEDIHKSVNYAIMSGFNNINLDLIFGLPGQSIANFQKSLKEAVKLSPEHISLYNLSVEPDTPLSRLLKKGKISLPSDDLQAKLYTLSSNLLLADGYEHYEISNFSRPGFYSRHNMNYWKGGYYLGFGPSAHSYFKDRRWWNVKSIDLYENSLKCGKMPVENAESLAEDNKITEWIMLNLRLNTGLNFNEFHNLFKVNFHNIYGDVLDSLCESSPDLVHLDDEGFRLTERGFLLCDEITGYFIR